MSWLIKSHDLTLDQQRAVEMDSRAHKLIVGSPGSGKTLILLHRFRYLLDESSGETECLHLFAFTSAMEKFIQRALHDLDIPRSCVSTIDSWCLDYFRANVSRAIPMEENSHQPDLHQLRRLVLETLRVLPLEMKPLEFALVDEGQDLSNDQIQVVTAAARHVTVCVDHRQISSTHKPDQVDVAARLGVRKANITLLDALRCSPYVTKLASAFLNDPADASQWQAQARIGYIERETPFLYVAASVDDEKERLARVLRTRLENNERVAVLLPQREQVLGFARSLREVGFEVETDEELDFASDLPKVISYRNARGLTFDSVLMPGLVPGSFPGTNPVNIRRFLFGSVTRASRWVYMSTDNSFFRPLRAVLGLADEGVIRIDGLVVSERRSGGLVESPNDLSPFSGHESASVALASAMMSTERAGLTVELKPLRDAIEFLSRVSKARVRVEFDGSELILIRGRSTARVPATGMWRGTARVAARGVLEKVDYLMRNSSHVEVKVVDSRLWIGTFAIDCDWKSE